MLNWLRQYRLQIILCLAIAVWSLTLGWGIAQAFNASAVAAPISAAQKSTGTDPVPSRYQPGYESYLEKCASCHIPVPPAVLPTETWKRLLEKPDDHYSTSIPEMVRLTQLLTWDYLSVFSRPLTTDEPLPLLVERSRYFKALHPRVQLPEEVTLKTCAICHPNAQQFDYRTLSPEWENAP